MKKFLSLLLAAAMLCTLLVGCGSKSDDSNGDYKPFVEVQGVSDDTILVGNTAATTGAYATVGVPFNAGREAAFKAYTAKTQFRKSTRTQRDHLTNPVYLWRTDAV